MIRLFKNLTTALALSLTLVLAASIGSAMGLVQGKDLGFAEPAYAAEAQLDHVTDAAGILDASEVSSLEAQAQAIEDKYDFGVYIVTVDDYWDYSRVSVFDAAMAIYKEYSLGVGPEDDGLMLLMSMDDRDYSLITYGSYGNYAFNDDARIYLTDYFLDDFGADLWYDGFADYLEVADLYLEAAASGTPCTADNVVMTEEDIAFSIGIDIAIILILPLIIALIVVAVLTAKMKSVAAATEASAYAVGGLRLTKRDDAFSHTTQVVTRIETDDSPSTSHSGGFSGTSGKF